MNKFMPWITAHLFVRPRWLAVIALIALAAANFMQDPHLLPVRAWATTSVAAIAVLGLLAVFRRRQQATWREALLAVLWLAVISQIVAGSSAEYRHRQALWAAADRDPALMARLGEHLVVGYEHPDDVRELARRGLIGGIFITRRNVVDKNFVQVRDELALLQTVRRQAGLPPLLIASDQEGGAVSRLSPPLPQQAALASILALDITPLQITQRAKQYATDQASALAALGVNTNFSPVVDLKPKHASSLFDVHTRIADRAISSNPDQVAQVALVYSQALLAQGVMPTLKHFPGLGSVAADTHHFSAHLSRSLADLNANDWRPFRQVLEQTPALLMVGHVTVDVVDAAHPASVSHAVLTGLIRQQWRFNGVMISDDMTMAPIYNRGLCRSTLDSMNAGMDLLLLSYDWKKYYAVMDCLQRAAQAGTLINLESSHQRLQRLPWREH